MNPVTALRRLIVPDPRARGTVVATVGDSVTVATARGTVAVRRPAGDVTPYHAGDSVLLVNGQLAGRRLGKPPVYVL